MSKWFLILYPSILIFGIAYMTYQLIKDLL